MYALPIGPHHIPDVRRLSDRLIKHIGLQMVAVPCLVPDEIFLEHLANRRFPAGQFIRKPEQLEGEFDLGNILTTDVVLTKSTTTYHNAAVSGSYINTSKCIVTISRHHIRRIKMNFKDQTVMVTGASGNLGRAVADAFSQ